MGDFMACSTCANCVKTRRGWTCRLGNSTRGGRWFAKCEKWEKKEQNKRENNHD